MGAHAVRTFVAGLVVVAGVLGSPAAARAASVAWDGGAGTNNWHDAANWSTDTVPGSADDVTVSFGTVQITAADVAIGSLQLTSSSSLTIQDRRLALLTGSSSVQRSLTLLGTAQVEVDAGLVFSGPSGRISLANGTFLRGNAGATIRVAPDATGWLGTGTFVNFGTFVHEGGDRSYPAAFVNRGQVHVVNGRLNLVSHVLGPSDGDWTIGPAATLTFAQGSYALTAGASITGQGTFQLEASVFGSPTVTLPAGVDLEVVTLRVDAGRLILDDPVSRIERITGDGGRIEVAGTLAVGPDASTAPSELRQHKFHGAGTVEFAGDDPVQIRGATATADSLTMRLAGNTSLSTGSARLDVNNNSLLHNLATGTLTVSPDAATSWGGSGLVRNSGLFVHAGANRTYNNNFLNTGSVDVLAGDFNLLGNLNASDGAWDIRPGARLTFSQGSFVLNAGASVTGPGTFAVNSSVFGSPTVNVPAGAQFEPAHVELLGGTLNLEGSRTLAAVTQAGGDLGGSGTTVLQSLTWTSGTQRGSGTTVIPAAAALNLGGATKQLSRIMRLERDFAWTSAAATLFINAGGVLQTAATLSFPGDADISNNGGHLQALPGGTIAKTGPGDSVVPVILNQGTVTVTQGALNSPLLISEGQTFVGAAGALGANVAVAAGGVLGGTGQINGQVSNGGTVAPGASPGTLTVNGDYTQAPAGTLAVEIEGTSPGTGFDHLVVTGIATLDGTLAIARSPGFSPAPADVFEIVTAALRDGEFAAVTGEEFDGGVLQASYGDTFARLITALTPAVSIADATVTEGTGTTTSALFAINIDPAHEQALLLDFATAAGTAASGADFEPLSGSVEIPAGASTATIAVPVVGDALDELDETFSVTIALDDPAAGALIERGTATGTVVDDDVPVVSVSDATVVEGTGAGSSATFAVTVSPAPAQPIAVGFSSASGTASAGPDFEAVTGSIEIPAGGTTGTFGVPVAGDAIDEPDETFTVAITAQGSGSTVGRGSGVGTIVDDDLPPAAPPVQPPAPTAEESQLVNASPGQVAAAFGLPSARRCVSRRNFRIRVKQPRGVTIARARIKVNRKPVRVRKVGGRFTALVDLRGLPKGRFVVQLQVTTLSGKTIRGKRAYRTCVGKRGRRPNRGPL